MALDPITASAIIGGVASGAGLTSGIIGSRKNRQAVKQINRDNKNTAWEMHNAARAEAVSDMHYNDPKQQMQRLKEAGLNPRMIYGSGGNVASAPTRSSPTDAPKADAPQIDINAIQNGLSDLGGVMGNYVKLTQTNAQTDNLRAYRELLETENMVKTAGIDYTREKTKTERYQRNYLEKTENVRIDNLKANTDQILNSIEMSISKNDREKIANSANVAATMQSVLESQKRITQMSVQNSKTQIEKKKLEAEISQIDQMIRNLQQEESRKRIDNKIAEIDLNTQDSLMGKTSNEYVKTILQIISLFK